MKLALNGATTMRADLETDIRAAKAAGFAYLEIWAAKLRRYLQTNTAADLKALFDAQGVAPYSINSIEHITFRDAAAYERIRAECEELCRVAETIGCPYVVVVPGKLPPAASREEIIAESARVLRDLAVIAEKHGVALAFEFLGQTDCSVQTLELANEIVKEVDRPDIGLVLDTFHFYAGGSTLESIAQVDADKLFIFHINDAEDRPREQLTDAQRLLPGLGILPLREIKAGLDAIGYDKVASIEIFRPEYWQRDPFALAKDAHAAAQAAFGSS
jgi:2-keto-myo-inositol isomerase